MLEQSPLRDEAHQVRADLERRGWTGLGDADVARLLDLLFRSQQPAASPTLVPAQALAQAARTAPAEDAAAMTKPAPRDTGWSPLENYAAWVDSVPRGRELLALLEELTRCDDGDAAAALLKRVFVDHLRYEPHAVEETGRLEATAVLRRLRTVARHNTFVVSLVELAFPYEYPNNFQPIFRLHPYGLVVAIAPGWNACQFVYRTATGNGGHSQRTRPLVGSTYGDCVHDNLVVWLRRLDLLRPAGGEAGAALLRRAEAALGSPPLELARAWPPAPLDAQAPLPGVPWTELPRHERDAFLQEYPPPGGHRRFWGLERALRATFPVGVADKQATLCYRGYDVEAAPRPSQRAVRAGTSWVRRVTVKLELVCVDGSRVPLTLPAAVPEVSPQGHVLLDGTWYRLVPGVLSDGRLVAGRFGEVDAAADREDEEEETEDLEGLEQPPLAAPDEAASSDVEPQLEPLETLLAKATRAGTGPLFQGPAQSEGAGLCAYLEASAIRKLGAVYKRILTFEGEARHLPRELPGLLRGLVGRDEQLLLVSKHFLRASLAPVRATALPADTLPVLRHEEMLSHARPPAWACPEASADLPPGTWIPVSAARLTPVGELAIPCPAGSGSLQLEATRGALWDVNPRAGGQSPGPATWWIAPQLEAFAHLPPGRLEAAAHVAARGTALPSTLRAVRIPGPRLVARTPMGTRLLKPRTQRWELHATIPALLSVAGRPLHQLLCRPGALVEPGKPWLEAPLSLWGPGTGRKDPLGEGPSSPLWSLAAETLKPPDDEKKSRRPEPQEGDAGTADGTGEPEEETAAEAVAAAPPPPAFRKGKASSKRTGPRPAGLAAGAEALALDASADGPCGLEGPRGRAVHQWAVPPGVGGTVLEVDEEEQRDRHGFCVGWRVTLVVVTTDEPSSDWRHLVLPDGRAAARGEPLPREDVPYDEDGQPAQLVVEDPSLGGVPPSGTCWFDGATGDLLQAGDSLTGPLVLLPATGPDVQGPDFHLRFRLRDGEGIPANDTAPGLAAGERLWWAAADPDGAREVGGVERAWAAGLPPYWLHLSEVLEAAGFHPPSLVALSGPKEALPGAPVAHQFQPATRLRRMPTAYASASDAPLSWRCQCGRVSGRHRALEECPAGEAGGCGTSCVPLPALAGRPPRPVIVLAESVLHPWRMDAAASLLGLTRRELARTYARKGAAHLRTRLSEALRSADATEAARGRLERADAHEREELLRGLHALRGELAHCPPTEGGHFFLRHLPVPPASIHPTGLPPGAISSVKAPLTRAYQQVKHASARLRGLRHSGVELLLVTAREGLQSAVCALFGAPEQDAHTREPTSLAELVTRLWPLTRAPRLRSVVPGTFRLQGAPSPSDAGAAREVTVDGFEPHLLALAGSPSGDTASPAAPPTTVPPTRAEAPVARARGLRRTPLQVGTGTPGEARTGLLTPTGVVFLPPMATYARAPASRTYWEERAARDRLQRQHLAQLVALFSAFDSPAQGEERGSGILGSTLAPGPSLQALHTEGLPPAAESQPVGTLALRELLSSLARDDARPTGLCQLLEGPRPLLLDVRGEVAAGSVERVVQAAFPGDGALLHVARRLLVRALTGWWRETGAAEGAEGWRWQPPLVPGPPGARRMLPPLALTSAWLGWPGMAAATAPVRFLLGPEAQAPVTAWSHLLRLALGLEVERLRLAPAPEFPAAALPQEARPPQPLAPAVALLPTPPVAAWQKPNAPEAEVEEVAILGSSLTQWLVLGATDGESVPVLRGVPQLPTLALLPGPADILAPHTEERAGSPEGKPCSAAAAPPADDVALLESLSTWMRGTSRHGK